jgi:hypothetical protein
VCVSQAQARGSLSVGGGLRPQMEPRGDDKHSGARKARVSRFAGLVLWTVVALVVPVGLLPICLTV